MEVVMQNALSGAATSDGAHQTLFQFDTNNVPQTDLRFYMDNSGHIVPAKVAQHIMTEIPFFFDGATLYAYHNGVYKPNGRQIAMKSALVKLRDHYRRNLVSEIVDYIQTSMWQDSGKMDVEDEYINVKNGLLHWPTGNLYAHTPERVSTVQLPVIYNPDATCPTINEYMKSALPADTLPIIEEMFGYCMMPSTQYQKAFMFVGSGGNGKSLGLDLLTTFIGESNVSNVALQDLEANRFKLAQLYGKMVNIYADLPHKALDTSSAFKSVVSGDRMSAEFKGRDSFDFRPFARLIFSANEIPTSRDLTDGFFRRWIIVPFPNRFEHGVNADENMLQKMTTPDELSGLLNVALNGLRRLQQQRKFTENEATQQALADYKRDSDNVAVFLDEMCVIGPNYRCNKTELYPVYVQWCADAGLKKLGKIKFNERLQRLVPDVREERCAKDLPWEWVGVGLIHPIFR
ncbi:DNA primase family protein [Alicyclobacillus dauci]|uniref:Phage/plasmid primase, P4 family n=1 Tax=Alicyclobacillus dauci TaxID=1475485 RepID=A0ABY6ZA04_9BACL|nr:DNA primase family protein [Alicyclobacillus dauci]WAH39523.1 phage/plasmid primase, P4 family [Alicyclobacillus dauci]WAH39583.1 phage/plasmid primase, P4 family [Alicyclobacillus dauci]